ncbi:hypothetical protein DL766_008868 [Monosporascus sp. MC13-8B]|uniref:UBC core domain-containing protein n=1 Tax=Monosporascus cannonballus TaxID=155416 RepID=A0ABY0GXT6_9PEZI|nr:hypothetical protein DL762_007893 [Monosporascus cannonballus]RYO92459.1 hypothetical protein DL763_004686 [Monosporascus cannonballus]RYP17593.1 hypothetical protein DL766_008868 [Monosporascus sp. MC13-8B]
MVSHFCSPKNLDDWEPKIASCVATLMMQMDKRCTAPHSPSLDVVPKDELKFDVLHWMWLFSVEAAIKLMLSKDVYFLQQRH